MFGTAHAAQLFFGRLFEPFDACSVEVREHQKHSNTELLQTYVKRRVGYRTATARERYHQT